MGAKDSKPSVICYEDAVKRGKQNNKKKTKKNICLQIAN